MKNKGGHNFKLSNIKWQSVILCRLQILFDICLNVIFEETSLCAWNSFVQTLLKIRAQLKLLYNAAHMDSTYIKFQN